VAAMAHVKLPSSEVVKLTRESGSPLALAMGRCQASSSASFPSSSSFFGTNSLILQKDSA
jgi:hypothetical protein